MNEGSKTPATVLQELMIRKGSRPEFECVAQSGLQHQTRFEYVCAADGVVARGAARSKKDAKQAAARAALAALAARGLPVPPPYHTLPDQDESVSAGSVPAAGAGAGARPGGSHVALLKELCEEYRVGAPEYRLVADTGPPHNRHFTMSAEVGRHKFMATANSKKAARQAAAEKLYNYLRENSTRFTKDFNEEEALVRAHEKAMERYVEEARPAWRPHLGQRPADYHRGLRAAAGAERAAAALRALGAGGAAGVDAALAALGLDAERLLLDGGVAVLRVPRALPALAFAGCARAGPDDAAAAYLRLALAPSPSPSPPPPLTEPPTTQIVY